MSGKADVNQRYTTCSLARVGPRCNGATERTGAVGFQKKSVSVRFVTRDRGRSIVVGHLLEAPRCDRTNE
jgi:hypothetical protein